ncbi:MAG: hypothetical protein ED557_12180 [Balneola sp.]|nr:MAG: hypothetical protein ED557_12180 [Balneola sp.]
MKEKIMKNRNKLLIIGLILMILLNLALLASIRMGDSKDGRSKQRGHNRTTQPFEKELGLTAEQIEQFKTSRVEYRKQVAEVSKTIYRTRGELYKNLKAGNTENVDSLVSVIGDGHEQLEVLNYQHFTELGSILTEEQKPEFAQIIRKMMMSGPGRNMEGGPQLQRRRGN